MIVRCAATVRAVLDVDIEQCHRNTLQRLGVRWVVAETKPPDYDGHYALYLELDGPRLSSGCGLPVEATCRTTLRWWSMSTLSRARRI
jgi:hypothetical protein